MTPGAVRIGLLGAARIAPTALVRPARRVDGVEIVGVAARDPARARRFAARHGIARAWERYDDLLADPAVEAVYVGLPNSLHAAWTIRALEAGKHVLCEKPLASNADEAAAMATAASRTGRRLVEAFHWRYHPLADRMQALVAAGVVGRLRHIDATFCILQPSARDIRYRFDLAGGATMDLGCYLVHLVRHLTGAEPEVVAAEARRASADVDRWMRADLRLPDGATARITCALWSGSLIRIGARIVGDLGELRVTNPILPHRYHRLRLRTAGGTTRERVAGEATYVHQLRAFVRAVREGGPATTDAADGVANMRVVDAIYQAAGLPRRGRSPILEARTRR